MDYTPVSQKTITRLPTPPAVPATCPCRQFYLNRVLYGSPECDHTTGAKAPETAVPFDGKAFAAAVRAEVRAEVVK